MTSTNPRIAEELSRYRFFIATIMFLLGLLSGALVAALLLRKTILAVGLGIIVSGCAYAVRTEWKYWAWKEAANPYLVLGPFAIGFGITITLFAATRELI